MYGYVTTRCEDQFLRLITACYSVTAEKYLVVLVSHQISWERLKSIPTQIWRKFSYVSSVWYGGLPFGEQFRKHNYMFQFLIEQ